jgi:hypothetical protein
MTASRVGRATTLDDLVNQGLMRSGCKREDLRRSAASPAAASYFAPIKHVKLLVEAGADVNSLRVRGDPTRNPGIITIMPKSPTTCWLTA